MNRGRLSRPLQGSSFGTAKDLKKVTLNPKYSGVRSKTKTGSNTGNTRTKANRSGELFKRITRRTLSALLQSLFDTEESIYEFNASDSLSVTTIENDEEMKIKNDLEGHEFIIMDIRLPEDFEECHIEGAINCCYVDMKRDIFPPAVYAMKNKRGKVLIMYAADENTLLGAQTATMLAEKKWDNVFMLTGGMKAFGQKFPGCLWGEPPESWGIQKMQAGQLGDTGGVTRQAQESGSGRLSPRQTLRKQQFSSSSSEFSSPGRR